MCKIKTVDNKIYLLFTQDIGYDCALVFRSAYISHSGVIEMREKWLKRKDISGTNIINTELMS